MDNDDEKVGYCKPPKKSQFKKGRSGNPKGRPRKPKPPVLIDDAAIFRRLDNEVIDVGGVQMTRREREVLGIFRLAAKRNKKAIRLIEHLRRSAPAPSGGFVVHRPYEEFWK